MESEHPADRRVHSRHALSLPWPAQADFNGRRLAADIVDISKMGAKFRLKEQSVQDDFVPGNTSVWFIRLPSGREVAAEVAARWIHRFHEGYIMGANFTDRTEHAVIDELLRLHHAPVSG